MKSRMLWVLLGAATGLIATTPLAALTPLDASFTYQGRLMDGVHPANGTYDMVFELYADPDGATLLDRYPNVGALPAPVQAGLFTVTVQFDPWQFTGERRWLKVIVEDTPLTPMQELTPAPYATYAVNNWGLRGNAGTTAGTDFVGTTDAQAFEIRVNGQRALRVIPVGSADWGPILIGGYNGNYVGPDVSYAATIGGGGLIGQENRVMADDATVAGGVHNYADGPASFIGGGGYNQAAGWCAAIGGGNGNSAPAMMASVAGGQSNVASARSATVGGGSGNIASGEGAVVAGGSANRAAGDYSAVLGGLENWALGAQSVVAGGSGNGAEASGAAVGGGRCNHASGSDSVIPGGKYNEATGAGSLAAGRGARALHDGSLVWNDYSNQQYFESTGPNQFLIHAAGGTGINKNDPLATLDVQGGAWVRDTLTVGYFPDAPNCHGMDIVYTDHNSAWGSTAFFAQRWGAEWLWEHGGPTQALPQMKLDNSNALSLYTPYDPGAVSVHLSPTGNSYINSGNVGIGTDSPGAKLTVAGAIESTAGGFVFPDGSEQQTAAATRNPLQIAMLRWYEANQAGARIWVGDDPVAFAFDGANMWVVNAGDNTVWEVRASDGLGLGAYTGLPGNCVGAVYDGVNVWVLSAYGLVVKVRARDFSHVGTYAAGPTTLGLAFDGANIWVTGSAGNIVTKLRASDGALLGTFNVGQFPNGIAFDGANIWVANSNSGNVTKLRAADGALMGTFPAGGSPQRVAFDGANMWVTNATGVTKLRVTDGGLMGSFNIGAAGDVVFDGVHIWVTQGGNLVTKLRAADGTVVGTYTVPGQSLGLGFDGANIWVAGEYNKVSKL